jgi:hypothetical protein
MARNDIDPEMLRLIRAAMDTPYPRQERNPGGLIGTIAAILVLLAVTSLIVVFGPTLLADRYVPAPVTQPTAAIAVPPNPRTFPTRASALNPLPPYVPQAQAPAQATPAPAPAIVESAPQVPQVVPTQAPIIIYATPVVQPTIEGANGWYGGYAGQWEDAQANTGAVPDVDRAAPVPETEPKPVNLPAGQPTATAIPAKEWKCGDKPCAEATPSGWGGGGGNGW